MSVKDNRTKFIKDETLSLINGKLSQLKSKESISNYKNAVLSLCSFCQKDFLELTAVDVSKYLKSLLNAGRTEKTCTTKLRMLRGIAGYIDDELHTTLSITVFSGHNLSYDKESYEESDLAKLYAVDKVLELLKKKKDDQLIAIIGLALECGLPTGDIISLTCEDVHIDQNGHPYIKLIGSEDSHSWIREYPLKTATAQRINDIVEQRGSHRKTDPVFANKWGKALSHRDVQNMLKKACEEAKLSSEEDFTIQKLNNLAIIGMVKGGARPEELVEQLGHVSSWFSRYKSITENLELSAVGLNCISIR